MSEKGIPEIPACDQWKGAGRTAERYIALPCRGSEVPGRHLPSGHVYLIQDASGNALKSLCFMELDAAKERYGAGNIFVTDSGTVCATCRKHQLEWNERDLRKAGQEKMQAHKRRISKKARIERNKNDAETRKSGAKKKTQKPHPKPN